MCENFDDSHEFWLKINKSTKRLHIDIVDLRENESKEKVTVRFNQKNELDYSNKNFGVEFLKPKKNRSIKISDHIDLHGYTRDETEVALKKFLHKNQIIKNEWVKIITGKSGILFKYVPTLLKNLSIFVSGYKYAPPKDGGNGAIYVRIRKK